MRSFLRSFSGERAGGLVFGLAALVYLAVCVSILRHSVVWLLGYVADDAFYYLQIARHLAQNGRSTFDGLNPTNGYHPGWMLLMTALARAVPDRALLLKASLAAEFGFQLATSLVLVSIFRRLAGAFWGWVAGALWLLSPLPLTLALYGVEAPFAQFAVAATVWAYLTQIAPFVPSPAPLPRRNLVVFGLSLALAFYGRTDQMLLAGTALALLLRLTWTTAGRTRRVAGCARVLLWTGGAFAVAVLPWYGFSAATCGTLTQDSGAMKLLWHAESSPGWTIHTLGVSPLKFTLFFWLAAPFSGLLTGKLAAGLGAAALLALTAAALWFGGRSQEKSALPPEDVEAARELKQITLWLGASLLLSGLVYGALLGDAQFWHLSVPSLLLFLLLAGWGARLSRLLPALGQVRLGAAVAAAMLCICAWHRVQMMPPYPWQRDVYASQSQFEALVPASAKIGCFDAGIPAYFSSRTIINLDGLVNHTAVRYWKTNALGEYVARQGVAYIANEPATVAHAQKFSDPPIPLTLMALYPLQGWNTGQRDLWRVGPLKKEAQKTFQKVTQDP